MLHLPFLGTLLQILSFSTIQTEQGLLKDFSLIRFPELVIGVAGPIGVDIDAISAAISESLKAVDYKSTLIKITDEISDISSAIEKPAAKDYFSEMEFKMDHASAICRERDDESVLMRIAIAAIRRERLTYLEEGNSLTIPIEDASEEELVGPRVAFEEISTTDPVPQKVAYIVRQIKRPDEVKLMRSVYGRQFILVSAYGSEFDRQTILEKKIKSSMPISTGDITISSRAKSLINRDADEAEDKFGQHLRDSFHLADVFIDGISKVAMAGTLSRFFNALFGLNSASPTKAEYGMYCAKSASLRSADLSRQVGAAIFTKDGELITQGCNEVPKAFGGTYWDGEEPDFRDVAIGKDPNDEQKKEVVRDLLERLSDANMLLLGPNAPQDASALVKYLTDGAPSEENKEKGVLKGAKIFDLTEYGRVVHAEMCALCDAARLGRPVKGSVLYCTTFPCHNCTKHILASGVSRVIFMEPYPKSKAKELHENEIELDKPSSTKVSFIPFLGISPFRYRDIFEKQKRKNDGIATKWYYDDQASPMIDVLAPTYTELERFAVGPISGKPTSD